MISYLKVFFVNPLCCKIRFKCNLLICLHNFI